MRFPSYGAAGVLVACLLSSPVLAYKTGAPSYSGKQGVTCTSCHGGGTAPTVEFSGPTTLVAGATGQYSLIIRGGSATVGGTDIAVSNTAALLDPVTGSGLKKVGTELTHSAPKAFNSGELRFDFSMTAPPTSGTVSIFGAGNSANGNNNYDGDGIATAKLDVTITGGTSGGTDGGTGGQPDAGTGSDPDSDPGNGNDKGGGCSATAGAPVLLFALSAAGMTLLRRRRN